LPKRGIILQLERFILVDTHQRPTGRLDTTKRQRTIPINTSITTHTPQVMNHRDRLVRLGEHLVQEAQTVADRLYDFQYLSDEQCHRVENRELRPLFTKLNDLYHDWQRARVAAITGDYAIDPMKVLEGYQKVMRKFTRAMRVSGLSEDYETLYEELRTLNTLLLGKLMLIEMFVQVGD